MNMDTAVPGAARALATVINRSYIRFTLAAGLDRLSRPIHLDPSVLICGKGHRVI